ncbi:hypothetical protein OS31_43530 [Dickeya oryzae]
MAYTDGYRAYIGCPTQTIRLDTGATQAPVSSPDYTDDFQRQVTDDANDNRQDVQRKELQQNRMPGQLYT